jgi:hypothetical protein
VDGSDTQLGDLAFGWDYIIMGTTSSEPMLAVKALFDGKPGPTDEPLARELAGYALRHGYLEKASSALPADERVSLAGNIGVALISKSSTPLGSMAQGYRYNFSIEDLEKQSKPK